MRIETSGTICCAASVQEVFPAFWYAVTIARTFWRKIEGMDETTAEQIIQKIESGSITG